LTQKQTKREWCSLAVRREKWRGKKEKRLVATIRHLQLPHTTLNRRGDGGASKKIATTRFDYHVALDALLKWRRCYPRDSACNTRANNFFHLKINKQCENTKMSRSDFDNYIKYLCENTKIPNMQSFFVVSSKINFVFTL